jgi:uncharacterized membrane protein YdjX (TVP38/TMEM64 family)
VRPTARIVLLGVGIAILAALVPLLPLHAVAAKVGTLGPFAPMIAVVVGAVLLVALIPRTPISIACGLLFGPVIGSLCALLAALVAAAVTFTAGRALGREFVARRAGRYWRRVAEWIDREGALAVAAFRSLPLGPYGLSGYAYGASSIRIRDYALGTAVAAAPSAVTYALLGAAARAADGWRPWSLIPLVFGAVVCGALVVRLRARALAARVSHDGRGLQTPGDRGPQDDEPVTAPGWRAAHASGDGVHQG